MLTQLFGNLVFIFLLVLANAFFVAAEFAIVKVRKSQILERIKTGHRRATLAKHITDNLVAYLSATQLGITLASLGLGWLGEPLLADMFHAPLQAAGIHDEATVHAIAFAAGFGLLTFLHIILGELAPKAIAIRNPERTTLFMVWPLQLFYIIFKPIILLLNASANVILSAIGVSATATRELLHSAEEFQIIVDEGARTGVLDKTEQELISSIFEFSNTSAKEIMVPRTEVVAVNLSIPREKLIKVVTEEGYSRLPVFNATIDNIVGIIYTKDLISLLEHRDLIVLEDIIRPAHFVPSSIQISVLMREMQEQKIHMAIVLDEFGGTQGIITMEDILEEIVGEIHDEYDEVLKDVEQSADGSALVNARITIHTFNEKFNVEIPDDPEYETLNGFLYKISESIPEVHEEIAYGDLLFTIMKKSQRRIRQVRVRRRAPARSQ
jgi:CBS domain containing-hemolysin-like protein